MSVGGLIGGAVGGAVGFLVGGPVGAAIGAGIGAGVGMMLDPVQPDTPGPWDQGGISVNLAKEGTPIQDALGTVKVNGNIIWSCCPRSVEIKEEQGGKGGGSFAGGLWTNFTLSMQTTKWSGRASLKGRQAEAW